MNTKKVCHSDNHSSVDVNRQDHLYLHIKSKWIEWVIDQPKSVIRLFHQCWLSDPYGTNAQALKTDMAGTTLKVAKKVLSDIGLFEFFPVKDEKTGKILSWKVKNLHGGRVNQNHREKPVLKTKTIDSTLVENLDDPGQNTYIPPSKILTTLVENLDDPLKNSSNLVNNFDDPRQDFRRPLNSETHAEQAFEVVEKADSLYLSYSDKKDRELSISAISQQIENQEKTPSHTAEIEGAFMGHPQESGLVKEPVLESFTELATPLEATSPDNGLVQEPEYESASGGISLSEDALNEYLAYLNSSNDVEDPQVESIGLEVKIEPVAERLDNQEEVSTNTLAVDTVPLEPPQQEISPEEKERMLLWKVEYLLSTTHERIDIPCTEENEEPKYAILPREDKMALSARLQEMWGETDLHPESLEFKSSCKKLIGEFARELRHRYKETVEVITKKLLETSEMLSNTSSPSLEDYSMSY